MTDNTPKRRLDEILVSEGLISEEQIKDALLRQKAHGGKFGSQLLYHRYIDEATLVKALSIQLNCEGVILSHVDIHDMVLKMIPKKVAISRTVIPFDYNPQTNTLNIACEDPNDTSLKNELQFVARGKEIKLFVAVEVAIKTAINKYYLGRDVTLDDILLIEIPDATTDTGKIPADSVTRFHDAPRDAQPAILLVTDEQYAVPLIRSILERDNYSVIVTDSADDAITMLGEQHFHAVFIKDTVPGDYIDLIDRVRKLSPQTSVRYYETASELLLTDGIAKKEADLLQANLDIFTSLLAKKDQLSINHSGRVGQYADKLSRRLGLPSKDRMVVSTAAYLHDLARYYYGTAKEVDNREIINLTVKLLTSINFSPVIIEMLKSMYINLRGKYTRRLPIEALGGNILTIADLFAESVAHDDRISLDKFDAVKKKLRDLTGKLFLSEVAEAFIDMIQDEVLNINSTTSGQVMILADDITTAIPIEMRLKSEGYRTVVSGSLDAFLNLFQRSEPDIMIIQSQKSAQEITADVKSLKEAGVSIDSIPTYLLTSQQTVSQLTPLINQGIEDILTQDDNLDLLASKIKKLQARINEKAEKAGGADGARGRLSDMNLIDLLQALGPGRKTVKISIREKDRDDQPLVIYLDNGHITHAVYRSLGGPEAVYQGLAWANGTWTVEPITISDIPAPNNQASNESILMEGCRLIDERVKSGQLL
ncbi:MAG: DUF4388 domain-containing protein [Candidatus Zixiibacteriota bacterium]